MCNLIFNLYGMIQELNSKRISNFYYHHTVAALTHFDGVVLQPQITDSLPLSSQTIQIFLECLIFRLQFFYQTNERVDVVVLFCGIHDELVSFDGLLYFVTDNIVGVASQPIF